MSPGVTDEQLLEKLRAGDEQAFRRIVVEWHDVLLRLSQAILGDRGAAEEIVQDTWIAVIGALDSFEGRSGLRTWVARIAINRAKTRAKRDGRSVAFSDFESPGGEDGPVEPDGRFNALGFWSQPPTAWGETPDALVLQKEARERIEAALAGLPESQRVVVTLRDLDGFDADEVCNVLEISESNQRVLLHRGRARLRAALASYHSRDGGKN